MKSPFSERASLNRLVAAAALAAGMFASQESASASCGDYVVMGSSSDAMPSVEVHTPDHSGPVSNSSSPSSASGPKNRKPCNGPQCSRRSTPPLAPVPSPGPEQTDWGIISPGAPCLSSERASMFSLIPNSHPKSLVSDVFRPPRIAASR
jgi:hypothetical protein